MSKVAFLFIQSLWYLWKISPTKYIKVFNAILRVTLKTVTLGDKISQHGEKGHKTINLGDKMWQNSKERTQNYNYHKLMQTSYKNVNLCNKMSQISATKSQKRKFRYQNVTS